MQTIPFSKPCIGKEEIKVVTEVLKSGWLTTGPKVKEFEEEFRKYVGVKKAIAVNSCTSALFISLAALGIKKGDEVIIPTLTFAATAQVIEWLNARPVLVDVQEDTYNIDPIEIEKHITKRTKAIIPVHYAGHPCNMDEIIKIAKKYNLFIIEDAAHACGASYKGKKIGSIGDLTCFSFYATKNLTTGEGGMIVTNDLKLAEKIQRLIYFGIDKDAFNRYKLSGSWYYEIKSLGYKCNMDNIHGALGVVQLRKLENMNKKREIIAQYYNRTFKNIDEIKIPSVKNNVRHSWYIYPILINTEKLKINRAKFIEDLKKQNISASVHFIPLHLHPYYRKKYKYKKGDFPAAEKIYKGLISLPLFPDMTLKQADYVIKNVKEIIKQNKVDKNEI